MIEGKCKYLVHLCIAASVIKARMSYNYRPGSCAAKFSVVKKGKKQGDYMWDMGPQSIESSKPQNPGCFLLQIKSSQPGIVIVTAHSQCCNPHICDYKPKGGLY